VHGVAFKKRAPRAIKEIRGFAVKAMVGISFNNVKVVYGGTEPLLIPYLCLGNQRCPPRPSVEQKGVGIRYQGRSVSIAREDIEKA